jgi:hypothetical protein
VRRGRLVLMYADAGESEECRRKVESLILLSYLLHAAESFLRS